MDFRRALFCWQLAGFGFMLSAAQYLPFGSSGYFPMEISKDWFVLGGSSAGKWGVENATLPEGVLGRCLHFDGSLILDLGKARLSCLVNPDRCQSGFTLSFWLKHSRADSVGFYLSSGGEDADSVGVAFLHKEKAAFVVKTSENEYDYELPFYVQQWTQFTVTWHADPSDVRTTLKLYLNGSRSSDVTSSVYDVNLNGSPGRSRIVVGGSSDDSDQVIGLFDELLYWDREISSKEALSVYNTHTGISLVETGTSSGYFAQKQPDTYVPGGIYLNDTVVGRRVTCLLSCLSKELCLGVNWRQSEAICRMFRVVYNEAFVVFSSGWRVYVRI